VAILCGGRGARLQEHTRSIPKPLVQVGGRPILWHVISIHVSQGFSDFLLLTGYRGDRIASFAARADWPADVRIRCVDTGQDTPTGGRLHRAGDQCGAAATMAVVRPRLPFGVARLGGDGERVDGFEEKPVSEHWVNAGFFVLEPAVLSLLSGQSVLEREPLSALARDGRLSAYRHRGFWHCMDTYKDAVALNDLWDADPAGAPWLAGARVG